MKRNEYIIPLSRDHHFGLLFCWKIRRGLALKAGLDRICAYVAYFWESHLKKHFEEEETFLFLPDDPDCRKAISEHQQIAALVKQLTDPGATDSNLLTELSNLLEAHIRYEERELFPHLEAILTPAQLADAGAQLATSHTANNQDVYADEFWVTSPQTGNV
ncbi:MAG TPA: hemerythrin domain-containing protein [Sediminibacterium sp.]